MNEWLTRGMVSLAAGALSTVVIVKTADGTNPDRKQRGKKKKSKSKKKNSKTHSPDRGAHTDPESESGLGFKAWWGQVKQQGDNLSKQLSGYARGRGPQTELDPDEPENGRPEKSPQAENGRKASQNGYSTLKEEAAYWAKSKVKEKVVESTGLDEVIAAAQSQTEKVKAQGDKLRDKISQSEMGEWIDAVQQKGGDVAQGIREAGNAIKEELSSESGSPNEWKKSVEKKVSSVGVWLEGPGAVSYGDEDPDASQTVTENQEPESAKPEDDGEASDERVQNNPQERNSPPRRYFIDHQHRRFTDFD